MKRISIIIFLIFFFSCKDNNKEQENKEKVGALSLLVVQMQNSNSLEAPISCESSVPIAEYIIEKLDKHIDCSVDSDCVLYNKNVPKWGELCSGTCFFGCGGPAINFTKQDIFEKELSTLNQTYCYSKVNSSCATPTCSASCLTTIPVCENNKCKTKRLNF